MGFRPASGLVNDGRAKLPQTSILTALMFLMAACGGTAERREAPIAAVNAASPQPASEAIAAAEHTRPVRPLPDQALQNVEEKGERKSAPAPLSPAARADAPQHALPLPGRPYIARANRKLQCVPYARNRSGIAIQGDAWTWWKSARGRYQRSGVPAVGAVLVLKRRGRSRGHLAVVTQVINDREIIVDHANWLNRGRIHRNIPVQDVSNRNDWSAVRLWHVPTHRLGVTAYRAYGFVYPAEPPSLTSELPSQTAPPPDRG